MRAIAFPMILVILGILLSPETFAGSGYVPAAVFCAAGEDVLCPILPAFIGPDKALGTGSPTPGYKGILRRATSPATDVQSPFDNMAWQMFVALNWPVGAQNRPLSRLTNTGTRSWQTWRRVEDVFGNGPRMLACPDPSHLPVFTIAANGDGKPSARNEEYLQASTGLPIIDINGNWTIYERRLNAVEAAYIKAPNGDPRQNLNTISGQRAFARAGGTVAFPLSEKQPIGKPGAIEIKAAWRILDAGKGDDPSRYFTMRALLRVAGDLVKGGKPICDNVTLGLVGMHIIQKTPHQGNLLAQWIWASFEHVDNAPLSGKPCDPTGRPVCSYLDQSQSSETSCGPAATSIGTRYSYFNPHDGTRAVNIAPIPSRGKNPAFLWRPTQPYAADYWQTPAGASPQAVRCWSIYALTQSLNSAWQAKLRQANSVFANYMLIGMQWGGRIEPPDFLRPTPFRVCCRI